MVILSIDTSCDETACAITEGRKVLSNVVYSQVLIHKKWGGVVPSLAKRAHEERIDFVIAEALKKYRSGKTSEVNKMAGIDYIDYIAVTQGPGLAIALEVGIKKAKELATEHGKKLIAVNHMEGHIYSCFAQNRNGNPKRDIRFPFLALLISGGHTQLVLVKDHLDYVSLGETVDDAAGEALDKAAKLLGLGYPGGPVIERLAERVEHKDFFKFPRPMTKEKNLTFSFSGLKTAFYYFLKKQKETSEVALLASSFQEAVFESILYKIDLAIRRTGITNILVGGGVIANLYLRKKIRKLVEKHKGTVLFPPFKYLTGDNAAMIGVAAHYKAERGLFVTNMDALDRIPRLSLIAYLRMIY